MKYSEDLFLLITTFINFYFFLIAADGVGPIQNSEGAEIISSRNPYAGRKTLELAFISLSFYFCLTAAIYIRIRPRVKLRVLEIFRYHV